MIKESSQPFPIKPTSKLDANKNANSTSTKNQAPSPNHHKSSSSPATATTTSATNASMHLEKSSERLQNLSLSHELEHTGESSFQCNKRNHVNSTSSSPSQTKKQKMSTSPPPSKSSMISSTNEYPSGDPTEWNCEQVYEFVKCVAGCNVAQLFMSEEVDGSALSLIRDDHLVNTMQIKLGPALKIMSKFNELKQKFISNEI